MRRRYPRRKCPGVGGNLRTRMIRAWTAAKFSLRHDHQIPSRVHRCCTGYFACSQHDLTKIAERLRQIERENAERVVQPPRKRGPGRIA